MPTIEKQQEAANRRLVQAQVEAEQNPQPENSVLFQRVTDENGRSRLEGIAPLTIQADPEAAARAEAINRMNENLKPKEVTFADIRHLPPTKRREALEEIALPVLNALQTKFKLACDECTQLESPFKQLADYAAKYIADYQHSKIKLVYCNGLNHRNGLLESGQLPPEGYKIYKEHPRSNLPGASMIVCIPSDLNSPADLLNDDETKAYAAKEVKFLDERAEEKRKQAAVALAEYKKLVQRELDDIQPLEKLLKSFGVNN